MALLRHGQGPDWLRPIVMALHWSTILVIVAWLAGMLPGFVLALHAVAWGALTAIWGLRGGPSPALKGPLGRIAWMGHWGMLALYVIGALTAASGLPIARPLLFATLGVAAFHATFNLWRAGVLGDGALRRMLPRALW